MGVWNRCSINIWYRHSIYIFLLLEIHGYPIDVFLTGRVQRHIARCSSVRRKCVLLISRHSVLLLLVMCARDVHGVVGCCRGWHFHLWAYPSVVVGEAGASSLGLDVRTFLGHGFLALA